MFIYSADTTTITIINLVLTSLVLASVIVLIFVLKHRYSRTRFNKIFGSKRKNNIEKVYDREEMCEKISIAVQTLSKSKTGALITFEKNDKFNEIIKSGTVLNSPISPELLTTIFYPGTRLHDGAVVVRQDMLLAASVYYTPTTKPLTGKYGSRHRAAIGISEITDSVTVVISEETGRISIAYKGELVPVVQDNFLRTLQEYLMAE